MQCQVHHYQIHNSASIAHPLDDGSDVKGVREAEMAGIKRYCEALRAENNILHGSIPRFSISHFVPLVRALICMAERVSDWLT